MAREANLRVKVMQYSQEISSQNIRKHHFQNTKMSMLLTVLRLRLSYLILANNKMILIVALQVKNEEVQSNLNKEIIVIEISYNKCQISLNGRIKTQNQVQ